MAKAKTKGGNKKATKGKKVTKATKMKKNNATTRPARPVAPAPVKWPAKLMKDAFTYAGLEMAYKKEKTRRKEAGESTKDKDIQEAGFVRGTPPRFAPKFIEKIVANNAEYEAFQAADKEWKLQRKAAAAARKAQREAKKNNNIPTVVASGGDIVLDHGRVDMSGLPPLPLVAMSE